MQAGRGSCDLPRACGPLGRGGCDPRALTGCATRFRASAPLFMQERSARRRLTAISRGTSMQWTQDRPTRGSRSCELPIRRRTPKVKVVCRPSERTVIGPLMRSVSGMVRGRARMRFSCGQTTYGKWEIPAPQLAASTPRLYITGGNDRAPPMMTPMVRLN